MEPDLVIEQSQWGWSMYENDPGRFADPAKYLVASADDPDDLLGYADLMDCTATVNDESKWMH